MDIAKLDKNFKIETEINKPDIAFYDAWIAPFEIDGVFYADGKYRRIPEPVAKTVNPTVYALHANTAGGRVRFRTDSPYVAISAKMPDIGKMSHFALCGSAGFDLYVNGVHENTFRPPFEIEGGYESVYDIPGEGVKEILINFPLYSEVSELYIGLSKSANVEKPTPYAVEKPIVSYGSSVTQGGCASRPGTSYQSFIARELNANYINLGFSGSAFGEQEIADYIASLDMSVFLMDYDYNARTIEELENTHERLFLTVRKANPELPIVIMSAPIFTLDPVYLTRREIIKRTYDNAIARGDKNVYLIDGPTLMAFCKDDGTVDTTHPTDLGFFSMAKALIPILKKILF